MLKTKLSVVLVLLSGLMLMACATVSTNPTPTIVPLDRSETDVEQNRSQIVEVAPTPTRLPLPSPTPTLTPILTPTPDLVATASTAPTSPPPVQAEVIVDALNVRQGPGIDYAIIGTARAGDLFDVVGVDPFGNWLQVVITGGNLGWISGQLPYSRLLSAGSDDLPVIQAPSLPSAARAPSEVSSQHAARPTGSNDQLSEKLIFMSGSGGELYSINVDGSGLRRLAGGVIDPAVSPDGQQVAFTRWDGAEFGVLYIINVDGSGERAIVGDIRQPKSPAWSPDGQQIVVSFQYGGIRDPQEECRNYKRGQQVRIPDNVEITWFKVRPDGSIALCFIRREDLHWRLRRVDVSTGAFEDLPSDEYSYNPAWDPRNPWRVLYDGNKGLVQLDVTNGQRWFITEDLRDSGPVFSPDGKMLALTYKQHDHWEVYTLDLETGARQRLTKPPILADPQYNSAAPAWSPDGSQLAFVTDRTGRWEIWVMNADGSDQRPLFSPDIQGQLGLQYRGVNERMLNWID